MFRLAALSTRRVVCYPRVLCCFLPQNNPESKHDAKANPASNARTSYVDAAAERDVTHTRSVCENVQMRMLRQFDWRQTDANVLYQKIMYTEL